VCGYVNYYICLYARVYT